MDRCPHCGRALGPDAEACPYCGSDFETGWNPDADYYGFELPSEEDSFPVREQPSGIRRGTWDKIVGATVVGLAALFLLLVLRSRAQEPINLVVIALLVLSFWFFLVRTKDAWLESH